MVTGRHAPSICHLRRSNAIRIKRRNFNRDFLNSPRDSLNVACSLPNEDQNKINVDDPCATMLEQIRRGVRLRRVDPERASRYEQHQQAPTSADDEDNLSSLLARVLEKRHSVMQQTDDESEMSSINSQPDSLEIPYRYTRRCERSSDVHESNEDSTEDEPSRLDLVVKL